MTMTDALWLVPHFHYDPVWWNTQAGYTQTWDERRLSGARSAWPGHSAFTLVKAHLAKACQDPGYRFVLAEVDYLKPYWDTYPEDRALIRRLIAGGRLELVGGTYNEPNTNLTGIEPTIRNAVHGARFQHGVLGGAPQTAWQLDVFGHDPQFPQVMSGAGLTSTAFARGPYHQWGPMLTSWNIHEHRKPFAPTQFPTEFEWVAPSGDGLLTHYMAAHYAAGFSLDTAQTPQAAADDLHELFTVLRPAAATRNVMIPMGSDFTPPMRWITELREAWRERYPHVQLHCGLPRDFFAAVRAEFAARGVRPTPQTRDMNPIYTGKDVTAIDTKQIHRLVESLLLDAEKWATFATLHGASYPTAALDKAWRLLLFGAHHDAVTGTQSDQVYLDLLAGWREAHDLASDVDSAARRHLAARIDTGGAGIPVVVFNPLAFPRTDVVSVSVPGTDGVTLVDEGGAPVPFVAETETLIRWVAHDVPSLGYRAYRLVPGEVAPATWQPVDATTISNDRYRLRAAPSRGGALTEITDLAGGRDLLPPGPVADELANGVANEVANELVCVGEHRDHPEFGEGPWHLLPAGVRWRSGDVAATVTVERCPIGERVTASAVVDGCRYTQHTTVWYGIERIDFATRIDGFTGTDQLLRVRVPCGIPGGMPVSETAAAVIGRGYALLDADAAVHPWTLDNTAHRWFGLGAALTVHLHDPHGRSDRSRAVSIAEIVVPDGDEGHDRTRRLAVALVRAGVTATVTPATGNRYGALETDSNLPDCRIAVGTPRRSGFVADLLGQMPPHFRAELDAQLAATGTARLWVPAAQPLRAVWRPGADVRGTRDLPVLLVAGTDPRAEHEAVAELIDDLADARVHVTQPAAMHRDETTVDDYAVALVNRGTPGFAVEPDGTLNMSLARACTGWPTGTAIDFPDHNAPDHNAPDHNAPSGRSFQHPTSRRFEYALLSGPGGWRAAGFTSAGQAVNHPLAATIATAGGGRLPATGSFLAVEPAGSLAVTAVDSGSHGVVVRGYEPHGRSGRATIRLAGGIASAMTVDLLDRPVMELSQDRRAVEIATQPYKIMSLALRPARVEPGAAPLVPDTEPVQPVFTRYWLHNSGPAPMGDLPVTVTLRSDDTTSNLYAQIASSLPDDRVVNVRIQPPEGWLVSPESKHVAVPAEGYTTVPVSVAVPDGAAPGWYAISATIRHVDMNHADEELRDALLVPVGDAVAEPLLGARSGPGQLILAPGARGRIAVQVSHALRTPVEGYVQLITPHHGWPLTGDPVRAFTARPGACARIEFPVTVPAGFPPGEFWAQPKVCAYGHIAYAEPVRIRISAD
jgi:alpha-mannosidase